MAIKVLQNTDYAVSHSDAVKMRGESKTLTQKMAEVDGFIKKDVVLRNIPKINGGVVNSSNGKVNTSTVNFYFTVNIPNGATLVNFQALKVGNSSTNGIAFLDDNGDFVSGYYNRTLTTGTRVSLPIPPTATKFRYSYVDDATATTAGYDKFDYISFILAVGDYAKTLTSGVEKDVVDINFALNGGVLVVTNLEQDNMASNAYATGELTYNSSIFFADVRIPKGADYVNFQALKSPSGANGYTFFNDGGEVVGSYLNTGLNSGTRVGVDIPNGATVFRYCYSIDGATANPPFDYIKFTSRKFDESQKEFIKVSDIPRIDAGVVDGTTGNISDSTVNFFSVIDIPEGASRISFPSFKTSGTKGIAFIDGNGDFVSGFYNASVDTGTRVEIDIPPTAKRLKYSYVYDSVAEDNDSPVFDYILFRLSSTDYAKYLDGVLAKTLQEDIDDNTLSCNGEILFTDVDKMLLGVNNAVTGELLYQPANFYTDIRIPKSATSVDFRVIKTSYDTGCTFFNNEGSIVGSYKNSTLNTGTRTSIDIPNGATIFRYCYVSDANTGGKPIFDYVKFTASMNSDKKKVSGKQVIVEHFGGEGNDWSFVRTPTNYSLSHKPFPWVICNHGNSWIMDGSLEKANFSWVTQFGVDSQNDSAYLDTTRSDYVEYSSPLIEALLAAGYVVCGAQNYGDKLYGNNNCRNAVCDFYDYMKRNYNVQDRCHMIGVSNGAMTTLNACHLLGPGKVSSIVMLYPLCDLFDHYLHSSAHAPEIRTAYGVANSYSSLAELKAEIAFYTHCPVHHLVYGDDINNQQVKTFPFPPMMMIASGGDTAVDVRYNADKLKALCDRSSLICVYDNIDPDGTLGYEHGDWHHFKEMDVLNFFNANK